LRASSMTPFFAPLSFFPLTPFSSHTPIDDAKDSEQDRMQGGFSFSFPFFSTVFRHFHSGVTYRSYSLPVIDFPPYFSFFPHLLLLSFPSCFVPPTTYGENAPWWDEEKRITVLPDRTRRHLLFFLPSFFSFSFPFFFISGMYPFASTSCADNSVTCIISRYSPISVFSNRPPPSFFFPPYSLLRLANLGRLATAIILPVGAVAAAFSFRFSLPRRRTSSVRLN